MTWQPDLDPTVELRDDEAVRAAVVARGEQRMLGRVDAESATFAGTLLDLAERRVGATLLLEGDHAVQGLITSIAPDHVVLATEAHRRTHVRIAAIVTVRADHDVRVPVASGRRVVPDGRRLTERLARWEERRPMVAVIVARRSEPLHGRLLAVGEDVLSLDLADDGHPSYLPEHAIHAVMVEAP